MSDDFRFDLETFLELRVSSPSCIQENARDFQSFPIQGALYIAQKQPELVRGHDSEIWRSNAAVRRATRDQTMAEFGNRRAASPS